jgi:phasin
MTTSPTPQFEIPNEMRAVAERNVEQAKLAFNNFMQAAQEAVSNLEKRVEASQGGALDISKKAMSFAERNILSAFEFAEKVVQTKDIQEMARMQSLFVQSQMHALTEQAKDLGETVSKSAMDSMKGSKKG